MTHISPFPPYSFLPPTPGELWRRESTWSVAGRLQISWEGWHDMHINERRLVGKRLQQKIQVQTTFSLRFSLSYEILAFRREHRPNAEQLNCWVYAFKLTYVSSCVELTVCRVDFNPLPETWGPIFFVIWPLTTQLTTTKSVVQQEERSYKKLIYIPDSLVSSQDVFWKLLLFHN